VFAGREGLGREGWRGRKKMKMVGKVAREVGEVL
jgi:hypothetical protein